MVIATSMFFGILLIFTGSPILNPTLCFVTVLSIAFSSYIIADMDAPYTGRLGVSPGLVLELAAVAEDLAQSGGGGEGGGEGGGASPAATASMPRLVSLSHADAAMGCGAGGTLLYKPRGAAQRAIFKRLEAMRTQRTKRFNKARE